MSIHCTADVEKDVSMKKLKSEEAITILKDMKVDIPVPKAAVTQIKRNAAIDMAINALKCSEIPNSSDTISRQAAIDALMEILDRPNHAEFLYTDEICKALKALPPAQPEIIHCGECADYTGIRHVEGGTIGVCESLGLHTCDRWFCGNAERRK